MTTLRGILATTHIDRYRDKFTRGALEHMVEQIRSQYLPFGYEHDPRIPPFGRVADAKLVQLDDGEWGVEGTIEVFEPDVPTPLKRDGRLIPVPEYPDDGLQLVYDRSHGNPTDLQDVQAISALLARPGKEEIKKALEPLSLLTIGGAFILGGIATGFLGRIGEDGYEVLKSKLKSVFGRRELQQERLFKFDACVRHGDHTVQVELILTNPTEAEIDRLLDILKRLDEVVPRLLEGAESVRRAVFEYRDGRLRLLFGVRDDAVPLTWKPQSDA